MHVVIWSGQSGTLFDTASGHSLRLFAGRCPRDHLCHQEVEGVSRSLPQPDKPVSRVEILLTALGIDPPSFLTFVEWALSQQLVASLAATESLRTPEFFARRDALRAFRDVLRARTGRAWSELDLERLFNAVKRLLGHHQREPLAYGDYLKLLWTVPHACAKCGREPPDVTLHVDHIVPVVLGGRSKRDNIQFLCQRCNLTKAAKVEGGQPWLDLT